MINNLNIYSDNSFKVNKNIIHKIISYIKSQYILNIDSLEINFVTSDMIHKINNEYLGHNYPTDVISFNYSNESNNLDGEIFICYQIAKENSKRFNVKYDNEIKRLIIHGLLHLIGYDDTTLSKKRKMKKVENQLLVYVNKFSKVIKN